MSIKKFVGRDGSIRPDHPIVCTDNEEVPVLCTLEPFLKEEVDGHCIVPIVEHWHEYMYNMLVEM